MAPTRPEIAVGGVVIVDDRLLLIQRGRPPAVGQWSVPGGRVERGETLQAAVERELFEETGLVVTCGDLVGWVDRISDDYHVVILDFWADVVGDVALVAGDDASDAVWQPLDRLTELDLVAGLNDFLVSHGVL